MLEYGIPVCNCKKKNCVRHGNCMECIKYHQSGKRHPYCKRNKWPFIQHFLRYKSDR